MITDVLKDIQDERARQDKKWGVQRHSPAVWITILTEEVGECSAEAMELEWIAQRLKQGGDSSEEEFDKFALRLREELVQVAAVAVAAIEDIDRAMT